MEGQSSMLQKNSYVQTSSRPRVLVWTFLLLAGAGAGYWVWQQQIHNAETHAVAATGAQVQSAQGQAGQSAPTPPPGVPVHAGLVTRGDFPVNLTGLGNVQAWNTVVVRSRVDGEVVKIAFEEGQVVQQGDVLVELDARPFQAALDQAAAKITQDQANLASASADLDRTKTLSSNGYASKQLLDQQTANVNQLNALIKADQAAYENANVSLSYTTIRAPIKGRLGLRNIDIGNIVHATDQNGIVSIAEIQPIAAMFTAPEEQLPAINKGMKDGPLQLTALMPDGKTELAQGTLAVVNNEIDATSGTIRLKGRFENKDNALWPGLSITTRLLVTTRHDVVIAPVAAVQRGPTGLYAYVIGPDQKVAKRDIKVSAMGSGRAVIDSGLEPGEEVVTAGHYRVQPGASVTIEKDGVGATANTEPQGK